MNELTLKGLINELTLIYNEYGDIGVHKDDECGRVYFLYPEYIRIVDYHDKDGNIFSFS